MKAIILATGKCRDKHLLALEAEYIKRLKPFLPTSIIELPHGKNTGGEALKLEESKTQLSKIPSSAKVIALDERGKGLTTPEFSKKLSNFQDSGTNEVYFIIGGSDGLHQDIRDRANLVLSLSKLTFPHQMVRPIITEQIYRAATIIAGHPYHRV
ncbi:MAG: 23S rRNA (pseudouridine(1915)-N(3))-methyltransferase RlmH [Alphaproteobacteria bacterium]|nr:23S rRNA (pseudouridine(1915)-N(3))-methyltransferase RlmH [Alphaproteobacteria bacterium]